MIRLPILPTEPEEKPKEDKPLTPMDCRIIALFFVLVGLGGLGEQYWVYTRGSNITDGIIVVAPLGFVYGIPALIDTRLVQALFGDSRLVSKHYKTFSYILYGLGFVVGLVIRYTVFREWKPSYYSH